MSRKERLTNVITLEAKYADKIDIGSLLVFVKVLSDIAGSCDVVTA